jgi:hypothetical protein
MAAAMTPNRSKGGGWVELAIVLVVSPVLYVASVGPVFALVQDPPKGFGAACYRVIYAPLWWLAQSCGYETEYALAYYCFWWGERL